MAQELDARAVFGNPLICVVLLAFAATVHGQGISDSIDGTYYRDPLNRITLQDDQVIWQYVTDQYVPTAAYEQSEGVLIPGQTLCTARGHFAAEADQVVFVIDADPAQQKEGEHVLTWDAATGALLYGDEVFLKERADLVTDDASVSGAVAAALGSGRSYWEATSDAWIAALSTASATPEPSLETMISALSATQSDLEAGQKTWAWHVAQAMQELNDDAFGIWYGPGAPELSPAYWTWTTSVGDGAWIPSTAVRPSAALEWYFGDHSEAAWSTECLMAARACVHRGLLDLLGRDSFDAWFNTRRSDLPVSNRGSAPSPLILGKIVDSEWDLVRGDWVYFKNWVTATSCPDIEAYQGENAICQNSSGTRTYIGLGLPGPGQPAATSQQIMNILRSMWQETGCPQIRQGGLALDSVATPSLLYFEDFSNLLTTLELGTTRSGISGCAGSIKHFCITVPAGVSSLRIQTSGGNGDCDLYAQKGSWASPRCYSHGSSGPNCNESLTVSVSSGQRIYIAVHGCSPFSGVSLLVRSGSASGSQAATSLPVNTSTLGGNIASAGDTDWYKFTVASPGTYVILTMAGSLADNYMDLYGPNSQTNRLESDDNDGDGLAAMIERDLSAGTYYVKIRALASNGTGTYSIGVVGPTVLTPNGPKIEGNISAAQEIDVYQFTVTSPGTYVIETWAGTLTDNYMYLYGPNSKTNQLESDDDDGDGRAAMIERDLTAGTYYLVVRAYSETGTGTYTIGIVGPSVLTVNGPTVEGEISSPGDTDWHKFVVTSSGTHTIETWAGSLTDNYMYLYGPNSKTHELESDDDDGDGRAARIQRSLSAGTYYVKVRAYSSSTGQGTYVIRLTK